MKTALSPAPRAGHKFAKNKLDGKAILRLRAERQEQIPTSNPTGEGEITTPPLPDFMDGSWLSPNSEVAAGVRRYHRAIRLPAADWF